MIIPIAYAKFAKMSLKFSMSLLEPSKSKRMSSTNKKCVIQTFSPNLIPLREPFDIACVMDLLNPSTTKIKRKGGNGIPTSTPCQL